MKPQTILTISRVQYQFVRLQFYLEEAGYQVKQVYGGEGALKMISQITPDLVILEWDLPDLSALAVTRSIRKSRSNGRLPIILLSNGIGYEDKLLALEVGVDLCLEETIDPKEMLARIRSILRRVDILAIKSVDS